MNKNIYFFSDAHLGGNNPQVEQHKEEKLLSFLDEVKKEGEKLYILGDLFEFWFEYKNSIPKDYFKVLKKLKELADAGIEMDYIVGNHDFWLGDFLEKQIGVKIHKQDLNTSHQGKSIFLIHGDGLAKKDIGYRILKKILRNPFCIWLYRLIPPDIGIPLAKWVAGKSRQHTAKRKKHYLEDYQKFAQEKIKQGYDVVIMGHTHHPELVNFDKGIYINLGDWFENFSYAVLGEKGFELKTK
jgi:UDP-2,3-diacylglucosamine hydrolase